MSWSSEPLKMIVTLSLILSIFVSFLFTMTKCVDVKIGGTLFSQIDFKWSCSSCGQDQGQTPKLMFFLTPTQINSFKMCLLRICGEPIHRRHVSNELNGHYLFGSIIHKMANNWHMLLVFQLTFFVQKSYSRVHNSSPTGIRHAWQVKMETLHLSALFL